MARIKIQLPDKFQFTTEISVRITDLNYGGHLGNDSLLSIIHESRLRFLDNFGFTEMDVDGASIVMNDAALVYKSQVYYAQKLIIEIAVQEFTKVGCDMYYHVTDKETAKETARVKTGLTFLNYAEKKLVPVPKKFRELFD